VDKHFIAERLLPIDAIEADSERLKKDKARLEIFLKANQLKLRDKFLSAGVLIPLVQPTPQTDWQVILTRRAEHLKNHPGEISFPGGRYETNDVRLENTAIRETHEEIGIDRQHIELIGKLPTQATTSQYHVTPFVAVVEPNYRLIVDASEVAEAFTVPLKFILDRNNHQIIDRKINGQTFSYYQIEYNHYNIWGATAQMIVRLSDRLSKTR
jgi:8-oxo-dGTP pyrophosphatase MutT (NUDIX family)